MSSLPPDAAQYLEHWLGPGMVARPLAGDASVRAYYRVTAPDGRTWILAYYPEEVRGQLARFLSSYEVVAPHARLPEVVQHCDIAVLQHDVGDRTLFDVLHDDRDEGIRLYHAAIDLLVRFQRAPDRRLNTPFTAEFFYNELAMAREFYVERLMGGTGADLEPYAKSICESVARHPYVLCHRDYHGQNIHIFNEQLFLIDYQDLRMGPDTYDLASLLRDRGVARILGDGTELEFLELYRARIGADAAIRRRYFETLLQRSIKILGTFAKQPIARGRMHYLDFIPATLESIERCLEELPEYAPVRDIVPLAFDLDAARERARKLNDAISE
ncbi:MAG TPA: phosphotransferase [Thermoanaerobaculia bacterium]|nr:phosphotransferase [Thermoanaerobaculia bacterium]